MFASQYRAPGFPDALAALLLSHRNVFIALRHNDIPANDPFPQIRSALLRQQASLEREISGLLCDEALLDYRAAIVESLCMPLIRRLPPEAVGGFSVRRTAWQDILNALEPSELSDLLDRGLGIGENFYTVYSRICGEPMSSRIRDLSKILINRVASTEQLTQSRGGPVWYESDLKTLRDPGKSGLADFMIAQVRAFPAETERFIAHANATNGIDSLLKMALSGAPTKYFSSASEDLPVRGNAQSRKLLAQLKSNHGRLAVQKIVGSLEDYLCEPPLKSWPPSSKTA